LSLAYHCPSNWESLTVRHTSVAIDCMSSNLELSRDLNSRSYLVRSGPIAGVEKVREKSENEQHNRSEYELLVSLLANIDPQNAHRWAQELLADFGSISKILSVANNASTVMPGPNNALRSLLSSVHAIYSHGLVQKGHDNFGIEDTGSLQRYLFANMANLDVEEVRALYLDNRLQLASDIVIAQGTLTEAFAPAREIFRHALAQNSAAIILVHNHPSGSCKPSDEDIRYTHHLARTANMLEIALIDHLIIARDGCTSLRDAGLMPLL
jgi:DNA repair protein RadC